MRGKTALFVFVAFVVCAWCGAAYADDVLLTQVSGQVGVTGKGGPRPAVPLLKVNDGDTLTLAADGRVQMVYLGSGRQEIWKGAGQVAIGATEGRSGTLKADASQLPALIIKQLARTPAVGEQQRRTGMVMVRGVDDLAAQDQLEADYADFRARAAADDPTPEVFLLTGLLEFQDYQGARKVLAGLARTHAGQPAFDAVRTRFTALVDEASAAAQPRP
jgi:hypothetical protein